MATETAPSRPVCSTVAPAASQRDTTSRWGNPCRLWADAETTATRGTAAATKGAVEEVRLPWCPTLTTSARSDAPGAARISASASAPASPMSSTVRPA